MPVQWVNIDVPIVGGVDTKSDPKLVQGRLLRLENGQFIGAGTVGKRDGYERYTDHVLGVGGLSTRVTSGVALAVYDQELLLMSSGSLLSYLPQLDSWNPRGHVPGTSASSQVVVQDQYDKLKADRAEVNGVALIAWQDARGGVRAQVISTENGQVLQHDVLIDAAGTEPRCAHAGGFLCLMFRKANGLVFYRVNPYDPLRFDITNVTTVNNDLRVSKPFWDLQTNGSNLVLAYTRPQAGGELDGSSPAGVRLCYVTPNGVVGSSGTGLPPACDIGDSFIPNFGGISVAVDPDSLAIAVLGYQVVGDSNDGVMLYAYREDLSILQSALLKATDSEMSGNIRCITSAWTTTASLDVYYEVRPPASSSADARVYPLRAAVVRGVATTTVTGSAMRSVGIGSQAFAYGTGSYVLTAHDSTFQKAYFLRQWDGRIHGQLHNGLGGGLISSSAGTTGSMPPHVQDMGDGIFRLPTLVAGPLQSVSGSVFQARGIADTEVWIDDHTTAYASAQVGRTLHIAGMVGTSYDGGSVVEHGFLLTPESASFVQGGVGSVTSGSHLYKAIYRWVDDRGQIHRSAPSPAQVIGVTNSTSAVTCSIETLRITDKVTPRRSAPTVELYRTETNGTSYYRVAYTNNDPTVDSVQIIDTVSDSSLINNEILYTVGGVLENYPPPSANIMCASKDRVFLAGLHDDPLSIAYSTFRTPGEGLGFNPDLRMSVDSAGGPITALASMDDKLIVFKEQRIFYVAGDGPADNGSQNTFTAAQLVTTDVGCVEPRSICLTAEGLMFKSSKGIYLLDRSLQAVYVGTAVEAHNHEEIVSADMLQGKNQVLFLTSSGLCLLYDYFFKQWSISTHHHRGTDSVIHDGTYKYLRTDGHVMAMTTGSFTDGGAGYSLLLETEWFKPFGLQGYGRVREVLLLGERKSDHVLSVEVAYDYEDSWHPATYFDADAVAPSYYGSGSYYGSDDPYGGAIDSVYQFRYALPRQKCSTIRFRVKDTGAPGEAFTLSGMTLVAGQKQGVTKMPDRKTV